MPRESKSKLFIDSCNVSLQKKNPKSSLKISLLTKFQGHMSCDKPIYYYTNKM